MTTDYPESGLDNVQLTNVPMWQCENAHQELQVPAADQLHLLLTNMVIRKPALLTGAEVRFLRKELDFSGRQFSGRLGMTPEHLSRLETGKGRIRRPVDLLVRLVTAWELARQKRIEFPEDLEPLVMDLESAWEEFGSHRLTHLDNAPPDHKWEAA